MIEILSFGILISAIIAIVFRQRKNTKMFSIFKPLTTILIISVAVLIHQKINNTYTTLMIVSLIFALIGDVFLIGKKYFIHGLLSFLIAHVLFTLGFTSLFGMSWEILPIVLLLIIGIVFFNVLRKDLHQLKVPVIIYIAVILFMNWQAIGLLYHDNSLVFIVLAIGSILFTFSDAVLSYDMFKKPFRSAEILILSTYWSAIYIFTIAGLYIEF
ncbi:MAG TPA: lysoplasmalogenase [Brumimicrobium sp.]|nr:lysoplasmalogenase [Brumimicrobium sp.]